MTDRTLNRAAILIIDSDAITLTAMAAVLDMSGYECHCAQDFEAALKALQSNPIDLMICDVNLRGASGLEMCRDLKLTGNCPDIPQLFVSAQQVPDIIRRVHDAGGSYYLRKPFDPYVLIELVEKALWMPHLVRSRIRHTHTVANTSAALPNAALTPVPGAHFHIASISQTT
ncbi:MAG: response regulator [Planctomycetes bacterium]|nr:response regulator [Planctomycetota bacterium]